MSAHLFRRLRLGLTAALLCFSAGVAPAAHAQAMPEPQAPIVIMVFSAFSCPYCAQGRKMIDGLQAKYPGKLRVVFKHFPLGADDAAYLPHEAVLAAAQQGRFWPMHDALFGVQDHAGQRAAVDAIARNQRLDMARFAAALDSHEGRARIDADIAEAGALKVLATPTYFIEGYKFEGLHQAAVFEQIIEHKLGLSVPAVSVALPADIKASRAATPKTTQGK